MKTIIVPRKENFSTVPSLPEILSELQITPQDNYDALSISNDSGFQIHLKRQPNEYFINNYFAEGLEAWKANIDIQPDFNHHKAITYMCCYFSRTENETLEAMKQAAKEAHALGKTNLEKMRTVARASSTKRKCSVQKAVCLVMSELWLRKALPEVIFLNSNIPEPHYRIFRCKTKLDELPEDSADVFQRNMFDRYIDQPDANFQNGKYVEADALYFVEFLGSYYVQSKQKSDNDNQPVVLDDELMESQHSDFCRNKTISLMYSKQKLKRRKVSAVLRNHVPNANRNVEGYAHHILFSFCMFRDEEYLKHPQFSGTYLEKLQQPEVLNIVHRNKKTMEPFSEFFDAALFNISE